jgi:hypothetical protein
MKKAHQYLKGRNKHISSIYATILNFCCILNVNGPQRFLGNLENQILKTIIKNSFEETELVLNRPLKSRHNVLMHKRFTQYQKFRTKLAATFF